MAIWRACASAILLALPSCGGDVGLRFSGSGGSAGAESEVAVYLPATGGAHWEYPVEVAGLPESEVDPGVEAEPEVFVLESEYVEPTCPPVEEQPELQLECSPFGESTGCAEWEGCYPMAIYPTDPCTPEIFGSECRPAGSGAQGEPCGGDSDCQSRHACVVSSFGTACAALCPRNAVQPCPAGLICAAIDVDGFGVCL